MDGIPSTLLAGIVFLAIFAVMVVRRGREIQRLLEDGVETTGTVVKKFRPRRGTGRTIQYEYHDRLGHRHTRRSAVGLELWGAVSEGDPFPVVYSAKTPRISAPKALVDASRTAMTKRDEART